MRRSPVSTKAARREFKGRSGKTAAVNLRSGGRCGIRM